MEKHPLQFFINLIEGKQIAEIRNSFFFVNPDKVISSIDAVEEYIDHYVYDDMHQQMMLDREYFKHFIAKFLTEKKVEILSAIDLHLLNNHEEKLSNNFVNHISNTIEDLILQGKQYSDYTKYPVIEEVLTDLRASLQRKYSINKTASTSVVTFNGKNDKLQWSAGVASLCTLFYELANDYKMEKKGISFIAASPDQLKKFILTNFVDEEGNPFSETSIATYLDSRTDKKAKRNKVDIDQIIPQSVKKTK